MESNNYHIKFTKVAEDDLDEIYRHILEESSAEEIARGLLEKIETSIMKLRLFPFSCNFVSDEFLKNKGYRKLIVGNYIAFYLIDDVNNNVVIMRIIYGSRKYQDII